MNTAPTSVQVIGVIVARLDSSRLPGKVLMEIGGMPILELVLRRVGKARRLDGVVLATTDRACDDPLAAWAENRGVAVFRGDPTDVAGRVAASAVSAGASHFVRLNADSPFPDPALIDDAVFLALDVGADLVTNLTPRSYPYGVATEVVKLSAFREALPVFSPDEREHVTQHLYRNPRKFAISALPSAAGGDLSAVRLTVDDATDLARARRVAEALGPRLLDAGYQEVAALARDTVH